MLSSLFTSFIHAGYHSYYSYSCSKDDYVLFGYYYQHTYYISFSKVSSYIPPVHYLQVLTFSSILRWICELYCLSKFRINTRICSCPIWWNTICCCWCRQLMIVMIMMCYYDERLRFMCLHNVFWPVVMAILGWYFWYTIFHREILWQIWKLYWVPAGMY